MEKQLKLWEEERLNETRQYECLRKYEKIVNQFDRLMDTVEAVTQLPKKRRKTYNRQTKKKSTSGAAGATHSGPTADEANLNPEAVDQGDSSKISSPTKAERISLLGEAITKHLSDLQSDRSWESGSPEP